MAAEDPGIWKAVSEWLWIALGLPLAHVWKKANSSIGHAELKNVADEARAERHEIKTMVKTLFANAEEDRRRHNDRFNEIIDRMNNIHLDLIDRIGRQ